MSWRSRIMLGIGILLGLAGALVTVVGWDVQQDSKVSDSWPQAPGTVVSSEVMVYYDPELPRRSVLLPGEGDFGILWVGLKMLGIGLVLGVDARRGRRVSAAGESKPAQAR